MKSKFVTMKSRDYFTLSDYRFKGSQVFTQHNRRKERKTQPLVRDSDSRYLAYCIDSIFSNSSVGGLPQKARRLLDKGSKRLRFNVVIQNDAIVLPFTNVDTKVSLFQSFLMVLFFNKTLSIDSNVLPFTAVNVKTVHPFSIALRFGVLILPGI